MLNFNNYSRRIRDFATAFRCKFWFFCPNPAWYCDKQTYSYEYLNLWPFFDIFNWTLSFVIFFVTLLSFTLACLCPFCSCKMHNRSTACGGQDSLQYLLPWESRHAEWHTRTRPLPSVQGSRKCWRSILIQNIWFQYYSWYEATNAKTIKRIQTKTLYTLQMLHGWCLFQVCPCSEHLSILARWRCCSTPKPSSLLEIWSVELNQMSNKTHSLGKGKPLANTVILSLCINLEGWIMQFHFRLWPYKTCLTKCHVWSTCYACESNEQSLEPWPG